MIGLSILGITWKVPDKIVECLAWIGVVAIFILFLAVYQCFIAKKFDIHQILKKYIVHVLVLSLLISFIIPLFSWHLGLFKKDSLLNGSDVLGYYGTIIGGVVTVMGIYCTFNYERLISAEGRKADNLPLLQFSIENVPANFISSDLYVVRGVEAFKKLHELSENDRKLKKRLNLFCYTKKKIEEKANNNNRAEFQKELEEIEKKIQDNSELKKTLSQELSNIFRKTVLCKLKITNIGLQTAILSSIRLCSQNGTKSKVMIAHGPRDLYYKNVLLKDDMANIEMFAVPKEEEISLTIEFSFYDNENPFSEDNGGIQYYARGDHLLIDFTDVYRNRYRYKLPIEIVHYSSTYSIGIMHKHIPVLPIELDKPEEIEVY